MKLAAKKILRRALCIGLVGGAALGLAGTPAVEAYKGELEDITLSTRAVREVVPDMAYIHFSLQGEGPTSEAAVQQVAAKVAQVQRALLGSNCTKEDYYQVNFSVSPRYDAKGKIKGYRADNTMKVQVKDLGKIGSFIDKLVAGGADNINNVEYGLHNQEQVRNQLLAEAVAAARRQAGVVAASGGRQVGRLLAVRISSYGGARAMGGAVAMAKAVAEDSGTALQRVQLEVAASIDVTFALE